MKKLSGIFLKGLAAILPVAITLYLLYWMGTSAEAMLGGLLRQGLPERLYVPGMGVAVGVSLVLLLGLLVNAYLVQQILLGVEQLMLRIPVVKTIYGASQDLMSFLSPSKTRELGQVVTVPFGDSGFRVMGFVTRQDLSDLPEGLASPDLVTVYVPISYQIGGYTLLVPREAVRPVNMTVEQAMRFIITAGVSTSKGAAPLPGGNGTIGGVPAGNAKEVTL